MKERQASHPKIKEKRISGNFGADSNPYSANRTQFSTEKREVLNLQQSATRTPSGATRTSLRLQHGATRNPSDATRKLFKSLHK